MLNLPGFIKEVDTITHTLNKAELEEFIHEVARTLPEVKREDFLMKLKLRQIKEAKSGLREQEDHNIREIYQSLKQKLNSIKSGELCIEGSLNELYDDWYNDDEEEFEYEDPNGVADILEEACNFVHLCIDREECEKGYDIAAILVTLDISVGGEYLEYTDEPLHIGELNDYNLVSLNYKQLIAEAMYVAYCSHELPERPNILYNIVTSVGRTDITLEKVMQMGKELPEFEEFLKLWIEYLGSVPSAYAQQLLKEAIEMTNDSAQLLECAEKYHEQHPALYEQYLLNNIGKIGDRELFDAGQTALKTIHPKYIVRSRIALLMSQMALRLDNGLEGQCWLEAFRSDTRVVHYLRLVKEYDGFPEISQEAQQIYLVMKPDKNLFVYWENGELKENRADMMNLYMLTFLGGGFSYIKECVMKEKQALGWSLTFMKCGLAAFLLLLLEHDSLFAGCGQMCSMIVSLTGFNKEEYEKGILTPLRESSQEWFWKCFCHWKKNVTLPEGEKQMYLQWIDHLIAERVKGIMENNRRNYYGECAAYIAALGEVKESMGEIGAKQKILSHYKTLYSRRRAFHAELRTYGMMR
mgnify:FL=1